MSEKPDSRPGGGGTNAEPVRPGDYQRRQSEAPSTRRSAPSRRGSPSLFWPIALIGLGVLLLLSNMGLIPATSWAVLWRLWPIALIALGLDVLIGRRSIAGAIAGGVLILLLVGFAIAAALFAEQIPLLVDLARAPVMKVEHIEHPLDNVESADVTIDYTSLPGYLAALQDSGNLIEADVAYRGELVFNVNNINGRANVNLDTFQVGMAYGSLQSNREDAVWDVGLAGGLPIDLTLDAGSGSGDFDLTGLEITSFELDSGSGRIRLTLPESSSFTGTIDGGSGAITIILPPGVGLRLALDDGSGSFNPGERLRYASGDVDDDSVWETEGFGNADYRIELSLDQGSGSVTFE
ncbi:MAG: hypothetical protein JXC32_17975 [Anaerolineae bacterium]|nr:hypothetical protein [Anaerolineae bacterium]